MDLEGFIDAYALNFSFEDREFLGERIWNEAKEGSPKALLMLSSLIEEFSRTGIAEEISEEVNWKAYYFEKNGGRGALVKGIRKAKAVMDLPPLGKGEVEFYVDENEALIYGKLPSLGINLPLLNVERFSSESGERWGWKEREEYLPRNPIFALSKALREGTLGGIERDGVLYLNPLLMFNLDLYKKAETLEGISRVDRERIRRRRKAVEMYMHAAEVFSILNLKNPEEAWREYVETAVMHTGNVIVENLSEALGRMKEEKDYVLINKTPLTDIPSLIPFLKDGVYRLYPSEKSLRIKEEFNEEVLSFSPYKGEWEPGDIFMKVKKGFEIDVEFSHEPSFKSPFVCKKAYAFIKAKNLILGELE